MSKKKKTIILVAVVCLCVGILAGIFVFNYLHKPEPEAEPAPLTLPETIVTDSASVPETTQPAKDVPDTLGEPEILDGVNLFGTAYHTVTRSSAETYTDAQGIVTPAEKIVEYYDKDGKTLLYKGVTQKGIFSLYDPSDKPLYRMTDTIPADFDGDPLCWLYKDGKAVLGEQTFFDEASASVGVAYYDAAGKLLCVRPEVVTVVDGTPQIDYSYQNGAGEAISEADFNALLPEVDAPQFLYIHWA